MEEQIQIACVRWFRYSYPKIMIHHSPNGGSRKQVKAGFKMLKNGQVVAKTFSPEAKKLKDMGTVAGFPDLIILKPSGGFSALFIEMKSDEGRSTTSQKEIGEMLLSEGYQYQVCRNLNEFIKACQDYLK